MSIGEAYNLAVNVLSRNEDVKGLSTSQRLQLSKLFVKCVLAGYDRGYREGSEKQANELTEYYEREIDKLQTQIHNMSRIPSLK